MKASLLFRIIFLLILSLKVAESQGQILENECDTLEDYLKEVLSEAKFNDIETHPEIFSNIEKVVEMECSFTPKALTIKGILYYTKGNILKAKESYFEAEKLLSNNLNSESYALNQLNLGLVYVLEGNNDNALICFRRSMRISLELGNKFESADAYSNMGLVKLELKELNEAEQYFNKANEILSTVKTLPTHGYVYYNLARLYGKRSDYDKAIEINNKAKAIWESIEDNKGLYFHAVLQAMFYAQKGEVDEEIKSLKEALAYTGEAGIKIAQTNFALGRAYIKKADPQNAEPYLRASIKDAQLIEPNDLEFALDNLYQYYEKKGDSRGIKNMLSEVVNTFKINKGLAKLTETKLLEKDISVDTLNKYNLSLTVAKDQIQKKNRVQLFRFTIAIILGLLTLLYITKLNRDKGRLINTVKENNQKLISSNEELAHNSNTIKTQNELLASRNEDLKNFAFTASHDIKSPLNTIMGYAGLLPNLVDKGEDQKVKVFANTIHKSCKRLSDLVSDLLEYAKIDQVKLKYEEIETVAFFKDISKSLDSELSSQEVSLEIEASLPQHINGDVIKLTQLFQNLISNSIKFSKKGIDSWIKVWSGDFDEDFYLIKVQDNGIGMAPKYLDRIFNMFEKLHNDDEYEGTGIGLAVCQKVAFLHQGKLEVESKEGIGTTFTLYLPKSVSRV